MPATVTSEELDRQIRELTKILSNFARQSKISATTFADTLRDASEDISLEARAYAQHIEALSKGTRQNKDSIHALNDSFKQMKTGIDAAPGVFRAAMQHSSRILEESMNAAVQDGFIRPAEMMQQLPKYLNKFGTSLDNVGDAAKNFFEGIKDQTDALRVLDMSKVVGELVESFKDIDTTSQESINATSGRFREAAVRARALGVDLKDLGFQVDDAGEEINTFGAHMDEVGEKVKRFGSDFGQTLNNTAKQINSPANIKYIADGITGVISAAVAPAKTYMDEMSTAMKYGAYDLYDYSDAVWEMSISTKEWMELVSKNRDVQFIINSTGRDFVEEFTKVNHSLKGFIGDTSERARVTADLMRTTTHYGVKISDVSGAVEDLNNIYQKNYRALGMSYEQFTSMNSAMLGDISVRKVLARQSADQRKKTAESIIGMSSFNRTLGAMDGEAQEMTKAMIKLTTELSPKEAVQTAGEMATMMGTLGMGDEAQRFMQTFMSEQVKKTVEGQQYLASTFKEVQEKYQERLGKDMGSWMTYGTMGPSMQNFTKAMETVAPLLAKEGAQLPDAAKQLEEAAKQGREVPQTVVAINEAFQKYSAFMQTALGQSGAIVSALVGLNTTSNLMLGAITALGAKGAIEGAAGAAGGAARGVGAAGAAGAAGGKVAKGALGRMATGAKGGAIGMVGSLATGAAADYFGTDTKKGAAADVASEMFQYGGMGAVIGSVIPVIGTAAGAAIGTAIGAGTGLYKNWGTLTGTAKENKPAEEKLSASAEQRIEAERKLLQEQIQLTTQQRNEGLLTTQEMLTKLEELNKQFKNVEKAVKENTNTTSAVGDKQIEANKELAQTKTKSTWVPSEPTTK